MTIQYLEPARTVIDAFSTGNESGSVRIARIVGRHYTSVIRWQYPKAKRGTGGGIPRAHIRPLEAAIKRFGIRLDPELLTQRGEGE